MRRAHRAFLIAALLPLAGACKQDPEPQKNSGQTTVANPPAATEAAVEVDRGTSFSEPVAVPPATGNAPGGALPATTLDPSVTQGLDPTLVRGLRRDPGQMAKGAIENLVTYADLSLVGVDLDMLYDYIYKPETDDAKAFEFPDAAKAAAGEDRAVIGYMLPLETKPRTNEVLEFFLVKDLMACCFGGNPRPDEMVIVKMPDGETCENIMYRPVLVRGDFTVGRLVDDYGYSIGVYSMVADSVETFVPSKYSKDE